MQTLRFSSPLTKTWRPFPPTSCHSGSLPHSLQLISFLYCCPSVIINPRRNANTGDRRRDRAHAFPGAAGKFHTARLIEPLLHKFCSYRATFKHLQSTALYHMQLSSQSNHKESSPTSQSPPHISPRGDHPLSTSYHISIQPQPFKAVFQDDV